MFSLNTEKCFAKRLWKIYKTSLIILYTFRVIMKFRDEKITKLN